MKPEDVADGDLDEIKQSLQTTIGNDELQQKLSHVKTQISGNYTDSVSTADRKSLNGSLQR